jgi:alpha-beta hydrolase superfamily lysophospholipase
MTPTFNVQIVQGQKDTRVEPDVAKQFYEQADAEDKALLEYMQAHHQLFQDRPDVAQQAMRDLSEWFAKHV